MLRGCRENLEFWKIVSIKKNYYLLHGIQSQIRLERGMTLRVVLNIFVEFR